MRPFFSLPWRILTLLVLISLLLAVTLTSFWISNDNQRFHAWQKSIRQQQHQQYLVINDLMQEKLIAWVEYLANKHSSASHPLQALSETLNKEMDYLELNWQLENIWVQNNNQQLHFSTQITVPEYVLFSMQRSREQKRAVSDIHCNVSCIQLISTPVLSNQGMAIMTISVSLLETLASLSQSTNAALALVHKSDSSRSSMVKTLLVRGPLAPEKLAFFSQIIAKVDTDLSIKQLLQSSTQVTHRQQHYSIDLLPVIGDYSNSNYLILVHDISDEYLARQRYQQTVLLTGIAIFIFSALLLYMVTNSLGGRLISLANGLPLLAQGAYKQFHQRKSSTSRWFRDELDILQDSALGLAEQLEQLDAQVQDKTRELEKMALYDPLTGLPNRNQLQAGLDQSIAALTGKGESIAILLFDLDDFKKVNDSHGHNTGDAMLCEAAKRLTQLVNASVIAGRFGGDEFIVQINNVGNLKRILEVAEKVIQSFQEPIHIGSLRFYVSISIGIASTAKPDCSVEELISHADIAMYKAKATGGNSYRVFDEQMLAEAKEKVALETDARDALANGQFSFDLQPQVALDTGELVGFEALLRWHHPQRGFVSPGQFIPILENTEFMIPLGHWCISQAFELLQACQRAGYPDLRIAINLAGNQFLDPDLPELLHQKVEQTGIRPELLELELTERTVVADVDRSINIMQRLSKDGFIISIDDFGTGYSSLSYLKRMPAQVIKIDRSFIDGMLSSNADKQIVASTTSLITKMGMTVIAEGIEQQVQIDMLSTMGCHFGQGYFIARPIPQKQLFSQLEQHLKQDIWQVDGLNFGC